MDGWMDGFCAIIRCTSYLVRGRYVPMYIYLYEVYTCSGETCGGQSVDYMYYWYVFVLESNYEVLGTRTSTPYYIYLYIVPGTVLVVVSCIIESTKKERVRTFCCATTAYINNHTLLSIDYRAVSCMGSAAQRSAGAYCGTDVYVPMFLVLVCTRCVDVRMCASAHYGLFIKISYPVWCVCDACGNFKGNFIVLYD